MSIVRSAILNFSKPSHKCPSINIISLRLKVSRICFTSATRSPEGHSADDDERRREYSTYDADVSISEPRDDVKVTMDRAKEKTREMKDKAKDNAESMKDKAGNKATESKEKAKGTAHDVNEKSKENLGAVADKAYEMKKKAMDSAGMMADKTTEQANEAKEKTKDAADSASDKTVGVAGMVADKAKQTVQGAWGAAKGTTKKIKETVVGKSEEDVGEDYIEDHVKKAEREGKEKVMDEDVVDLRRREAEEKDQNK